MHYTFLIGLIGSLILVAGSAWPEAKTNQSTKSTKNWLFTIGAFLLLVYAVMGYTQSGSIFFVLLEALAVVASLLMMIGAKEKLSTAIITISGIILILCSLYLFEDLSTILFIFGLCGIALGYTFKKGSLRKHIALTLGGVFIAIFSYLEATWLFFWLNLFFAGFSAYHLYKALKLK